MRTTTVRSKPLDSLVALIRIAILLLGVYWLAIFVATHLPSSSLPSLGSDKVYHLIAFGGLSFLLSWVVSLRLPRLSTQMVVVLVTTTLYAIFDEWSQQFIAGRTCDVFDAVADCCGSALGILAYQMLRPLVLRVPSLTFLSRI